MIAIDGQRQRDDRDHHRVARAHFHERLWPGRGSDEDGDDQLVGSKRVPLRPDQELRQRDATLAANARELDDRVTDQ